MSILDKSLNGKQIKKRKFPILLLKIGLTVFVGMITYESTKQLIVPDITIWQSHITTICFSTTCAVLAAFFVLRKQIKLTEELMKKNEESEKLHRELEKTIKELEEAISEVKTLSGMLPICASCKKIRDDKGYWNQIESYLKKHSELNFSHSICPECAKKMYSKLNESVKEK